MRIRIFVDGDLTIFELFWADYDKEEGVASFFTLDDDVVCVSMSYSAFELCSGDLLLDGYSDLKMYKANFFEI